MCILGGFYLSFLQGEWAPKTHFHISNFYLELSSPPAKSLRSVTELSIVRIDIVTRYSKPSYLSHSFLEILLELNLSVKLGWTIRFGEKICFRFASYLLSKWWPIPSSRITGSMYNAASSHSGFDYKPSWCISRFSSCTVKRIQAKTMKS